MDTIDLVLESHDPPATEPACPVCSGPLIPLRDIYRCARCSHSFCESCEGGAESSGFFD